MFRFLLWPLSRARLEITALRQANRFLSGELDRSRLEITVMQRRLCQLQPQARDGNGRFRRGNAAIRR
ncbi:hypothetical protein CFR75_15825 [Komagataeibacter xylinus]|uniref:Uncharacterized protein n=1 Tax=Komagataeibacter xylinus TaxID=28448 RepID=A0A318PHC8_KOMXY|nr:hypothetical protein CFR75_15825 [Komagataeibacter xylinus]GBQ72882.1 hypothetical protein AA15237_1469 [Komagataeibacter xylinus NBRC 15237]